MALTNRTKIILVAVTAFLGGAISGGVAGGYVAIYFTSHFFTDGWMLGNGTDTLTNVSILQNIRDGKTEKAIDLLEAILDGKIITLQASEENTDRTNKIVTKAIQTAKDYRSKYPRQTNLPEVDQGISNILNQNTK